METLGSLEREVLEIEPSLRRAFLSLRKSIQAQAQEVDRLSRSVERHQRLLENGLRLTAASGVDLIASEALDLLIGLAGAQRGFVGLVEGAGWRMIVARSMAEEDLAAPEG